MPNVFSRQSGHVTNSRSDLEILILRRSANHVDKILGGVKPRDLPVEQIERLELVINVNTARQIGRKFPPRLCCKQIE